MYHPRESEDLSPANFLLTTVYDCISARRGFLLDPDSPKLGTAEEIIDCVCILGNHVMQDARAYPLSSVHILPLGQVPRVKVFNIWFWLDGSNSFSLLQAKLSHSVLGGIACSL